jgi:tetratricopeptide (TPR) repeat protein
MDKAIEAYREAVNLVTCPMSYLAWLYQKEGNFDEGLLLAQVSVMMNPNEADYVDTLAVILCKMGKREEALPLMEKAAELKPNKFSSRLENFQKGFCE